MTRLDSVEITSAWENGRGDPRSHVVTGDFTEVTLRELAEFWPSLGVTASVSMRSHGNPPGTYVAVTVKVGGESVLEWSGVAPSPGSVGDRARGMLDRSSTHVRGTVLVGDPSAHEVTVVEDLCGALESPGADGDFDALAAGRLLLSSAAYQRARALRDAGGEVGR